MCRWAACGECLSDGAKESVTRKSVSVKSGSCFIKRGSQETRSGRVERFNGDEEDEEDGDETSL